MKVEVQNEKKFTPVSVKITFEHEVELHLMKDLFGASAYIAEQLYDEYEDQNKLSYFMNQIRDSLP